MGSQRWMVGLMVTMSLLPTSTALAAGGEIVWGIVDSRLPLGAFVSWTTGEDHAFGIGVESSPSLAGGWCVLGAIAGVHGRATYLFPGHASFGVGTHLGTYYGGQVEVGTSWRLAHDDIPTQRTFDVGGELGPALVYVSLVGNLPRPRHTDRSPHLTIRTGVRTIGNFIIVEECDN